MYDTSIGWRFINPKIKEIFGVDSMGETAENVAVEFKINRQDQDLFAYHSQMKAKQATGKGRLAKEIMPVEINQKKAPAIIFELDEFIRPDTTLEILAKLKPTFSKGADGTVTAGNSSGINDGACSLLIASEDSIKKYGLKPKVRIVSSAVIGVEPRIMGIGPVGATKNVLMQTGLSLSDMDVIELNEAFAAQSLACIRELGLADDDPRINPNGGAIALGHPLGMSGARLLLTAMRELEEKKLKYALCTMCVGVGQGMATIIERT
jgi:3-oxo-5,6-didehydrosuberyl-CoA/3-oxoadipyl-CoA thiolase